MAIKERGEGTYLVRVYVGRDPIRKKRIQINETVHGTIEDAQRKEQILKAKVKEGEVTGSPRMTVKQLVESYLESTRRRRGEARQRNLRYILEKYVLPRIGSIQIAKIKRSDIQRLLDFFLDPKKEEADERNNKGKTVRSRPRS